MQEKGIVVDSCDTWWADIYISGSYRRVCDILQRFVMKNCQLCITVSRTSFIYTGGFEEGVIIGVKNYPRFKKENTQELLDISIYLAKYLRENLYQKTALIVTQKETIWLKMEE